MWQYKVDGSTNLWYSGIGQGCGGDKANVRTHDNILLQVRYQRKYFDGSNEFLGGSEKPCCNLLLEIHFPETTVSKVGYRSTKTSQSNASPQMSRPKATEKLASPTNLVQRSKSRVKSRKSVPRVMLSLNQLKL